MNCISTEFKPIYSSLIDPLQIQNLDVFTIAVIFIYTYLQHIFVTQKLPIIQRIKNEKLKRDTGAFTSLERCENIELSVDKKNVLLCKTKSYHGRKKLSLSVRKTAFKIKFLSVSKIYMKCTIFFADG